MMKAYDDLLTRYADIRKLGLAGSILMWDQNTYMPPGAVEMRGEQQALIAGIAHERLTSDRMGELIRECSSMKDMSPEQASIVREIERQYRRASAIPERIVKELSGLEPVATQRWVQARKMSDFSIFRDSLEKMLSLKREVAELIGYDDIPYDALLDEYEPYMKSRMVREIFGNLRERLIPIVRSISDAVEPGDESARGDFPIPKQESFFRMILERMGYDFNRGRIDVTAHPFTSGSMDDVRVTLRYDENDIRPGLFGTIHEGGHALYEQGFLKEHYYTPLAEPISLGIHESQSRLWENLIGRSVGFWKAFFPLLQEAFPVMKNRNLEDFHGAINIVRPSPIRVEADEVTYSMHIMVRFEIETELMDGKLDVDDIPQVWNEKYEKYLGLELRNDSEGCLQDIHWAMGAVGYFPTYALGNLYSAQFYDRALESIDGMEESISRGEFSSILGWLRENIHQKGKLHTAEELVEKVTGHPLTEDHFISYLKRKYSSIYGITL